MGKYRTQTWMIDVRPWFDFPRPIPSCQPIFWSNLLPTLSDPIPDFVGSSYEIEATSSLVLRYFSCKHHHHRWSNTLTKCLWTNAAQLQIHNGDKIQQNLQRLTNISGGSKTPALQRLSPSLKSPCASSTWHGSQAQNIGLTTLKPEPVKLLMEWEVT